MKKTSKILTIAIIAMGLLAIVAGYVVFISTPLGIIARGNPNAGTWNDDPGNWKRAFGQDPPDDVSVIHSYYWMSDHFTTEFIYFFEITASPQWRDSFIKQREAELVAAPDARSFDVGYDKTPAWFVTTPVEIFDVWDRTGYHGSIWMNKTNEHLYFYGVQL